ncbi:GDSL-type esterase/lipase family protein [Marinicrinis sediminis]|uniref:GDSL-type esterase/lipase family protein n=1 Tax=Marinicrinis sediminis TaxID=1652465 RepID=A0ABW5RE11_9BACL
MPDGEGLVLDSPTEEDGEKNPDDQYTIVTLGDSLTKGTGDATGNDGYAGMVKQGLAEKEDEQYDNLEIYKFAIDGYTTGQLLESVQNRTGVIEAIKKADLILMTIGGNDLFTISEEVDPALYDAREESALANISAIFETLQAHNPDAEVIYTGLYNPFLSIDQEGEMMQRVQQWNFKVSQLTNPYEHITLISTVDLFLRDQDRFFSSDHYHPNETGYERIAERILQYLE